MHTAERDLEKKLATALAKLNCLVYKFVSPGNSGVPDRIVILPTGKIYFVELKTYKGTLDPLQKVQIERIKKHKAYCRVVIGNKGVDKFIEEVRSEIHPA